MTASDVSRRVLWLPDGVDQSLAEEHIGGETYWTLTDHLGTVRDLVYHNGSAVILAQHNELDAFGRLLSTPTVETLALYTGRFFDMVTALQYNRARWYDASVGRWMSTDPIGFAAADANLYRYVGNGVTWQVDPEGMEVVPPKYSYIKKLYATKRDIEKMLKNAKATWRVYKHGANWERPKWTMTLDRNVYALATELSQDDGKELARKAMIETMNETFDGIVEVIRDPDDANGVDVTVVDRSLHAGFDVRVDATVRICAKKVGSKTLADYNETVTVLWLDYRNPSDSVPFDKKFWMDFYSSLNTFAGVGSTGGKLVKLAWKEVQKLTKPQPA